jgi:hypothetical protein
MYSGAQKKQQNVFHKVLLNKSFLQRCWLLFNGEQRLFAAAFA